MRKNAISCAFGLAVASAIAVTVFLVNQKTRPSYEAAYFFDESRFGLVRTGMSADEVRDLIGLPLWRSKLTTGDVIWNYSSMPGPVREWIAFQVRFDASQRVKSAERLTASQEMDPDTGQYLLRGKRPPRPPELLSALALNMIQGEAPRFGIGEERYLVQVMASWCTPCTTQRPKVEALLANANLPIKLMLVSIDEDKEALHSYLRKHRIEHPVAWDPHQSMPGFRQDKGIPRYALLQDGMICWFDFEHSSTTGLTVILADLSWFIRYPDFQNAVQDPVN